MEKVSDRDCRKCRHPITLRKAISVLATYPRQETLWANRQSYITAKYGIELEEASLAYLPLELLVPRDRHRRFKHEPSQLANWQPPVGSAHTEVRYGGQMDTSGRLYLVVGRWGSTAFPRNIYIDK